MDSSHPASSALSAAYKHSPFLADLDSSTSPPALQQQTNRGSPFEHDYPDFSTSVLGSPDLDQATGQPSIPPTPFTPSYAAQAGSYNNSPLGSDLSFSQQQHIQNHANELEAFDSYPYDGNLNTFDSFNDFSAIDIDVLPPGSDDFDAYDPAAYDAPADHNSLLFSNEFMASLTDAGTSKDPSQNNSASPSLSTSSLGSGNGMGPQVSVTLAESMNNGLKMGVGSYGSPFDHGSPASSNGDNAVVDQQQRFGSRASSVSSHPGQNHSRSQSQSQDYSATYGMENVSFSTPPPPGGQRGPHSPPSLYIPSVAPEIAATPPSPTHSTHSHHSDHGLALGTGAGIGMGTQLPSGNLSVQGVGIHIVPATPVCPPGVSTDNARESFQPALETLHQDQADSSSVVQARQWTHSPQPTYMHQQRSVGSRDSTSPMPTSQRMVQLPRAPPSPYNFSTGLAPPQEPNALDNSVTNSSQYTPSPQPSPHLGALQLGLSQSQGDEDQGQNQGDFLIPIGQNLRTRSKSDTSLRPPAWQVGMNFGQPSQTHSPSPDPDSNAYEQITQLPSLTPPTSASASASPMIQPPPLPPHFSFGPPPAAPSAPSLPTLPSINDTNNGFLSPNVVNGSDLRRAKSDGYGHRRNALSADMSPRYLDATNTLFPPAAHQNFLSRQQITQSQFLAPGLGSTDLATSAGVQGHIGAHRRSFSHSHSHSRSLSRERVTLSTSPYPSPHASPRASSNEPLPDVYSAPPTTSVFPPQHGNADVAVHVMSADAQGRPTVQSQTPIIVPRQNVTTHATADASQRRRRTEATFVCPVPGCGSTFTRHFNLKGHLRSHNEERPFKCKWPGCDKGFARQHDCKRHEQLHLNIRPYTCQGCNRTFARMDALNRHLRSDAGTECQARQPILTNEQSGNAPLASIAGNSESGLLSFKSESEVDWQTSQSGVMV